MTTGTGPLIVPPVRLEPAYADRDATCRTLVNHAPYPLMAAGAGYAEMMKWAPIEPWFRTSWAVGGKSCDAEIAALLQTNGSSRQQDNFSAPRWSDRYP